MEVSVLARMDKRHVTKSVTNGHSHVLINEGSGSITRRGNSWIIPDAYSDCPGVGYMAVFYIYL